MTSYIYPNDTIKLYAIYSINGVPQPGLTDMKVSIYDASGAVVLPSTPLSENLIIIGEYYYLWNTTGLDVTKKYYVYYHKASNIIGTEDYAFDQMASVINYIKDMTDGKWKIVGTQMIFYKGDNTTEVARYNLLNANGQPSVDPVYERQKV